MRLKSGNGGTLDRMGSVGSAYRERTKNVKNEKMKHGKLKKSGACGLGFFNVSFLSTFSMSKAQRFT